MNEIVNTTHWEDLAEGYDTVMHSVPVMEQLIEKIVSNIPENAQTILDLGVGTGALLEKIRFCFPNGKLYGLDISDAMLEKARLKLGNDDNIQLIACSAHTLQTFEDQSLDVVVSNYALHHLTHHQKEECAKEVYRVLKKGGVFIFGDQHCYFMGEPSDPKWVEHMLDLLYKKAKHYLHTATIDRMLLQISLMPKFLKADGEIMATVDYWLTSLEKAGFKGHQTHFIEPKELLNCVIYSKKN